MRRLNLSFFMNLGAQVGALSTFSITQESAAVVKAQASQLRDNLNLLLSSDANPMQLPATAQQSTSVFAIIDQVLRAEESVIPNLSTQLWIQTSRLDTVLQSEMAVQAVYHIWPKRAYDTNRLINSPESLFSAAVIQELTANERLDVDQAGKCLAFEVPTAAAFHLLRLTESLIRRYYTVVVGVSPAVKARNWGAYIRNLRKHDANPKVLFALEEIKDVYRNPVIHPEDSLTMDEALSLIGIVETTVSTIHADMMFRQSQSETLPFPPPVRAVTNALAV